MSVSVLILRLAIAFITLLTLTRLMGRKEISQMTFYNFVSAIAIGTIGASLAIDQSISIRNGMIALVGWSAFTILMAFMDIKSKTVRKAVIGEPIILIRQGQIMENALRKVRLDMDSLNALLRKKNIFSASDVEYAIFEIDGTLSVMKKEMKLPLTKSDMNIQKPNVDLYPIPIAIITDGNVNESNLNKLNLDREWLEEQLHLSGINSISDIFYAEVQKDGTLYIDNKNDMLH
ncbi:YetF domain-containing protein [Schinkia sp. CFF1]